MALGDSYATLAELKTYANATKDTYDTLLTDALEAASRAVEQACNRQFNDAGSATARVYYPDHSCLVRPDDFHTTTGLVVKTDTGNDGTFETTWAAADFEVRPLNGVVSGQAGWPYNQIWSDGSLLFPTGARRAPVEVTARWGWAAVPKPIKQATLIIAEELYKLKDAPFGVAGNGTYGEIRVRDNPMAMKKLMPYVINPVMVG